MRVVVTGGAGFIGGHIADALVARGDEVLVIDDLSTGVRANVPESAALEVIDICEHAKVNAALDAFKPEVICHQAAQASVSVSVTEPMRDAEVNALASLNLLEWCRRGGARFVYASTGGAIYGDIPEGEQGRLGRPPAPLSPYAVSKLATEGYLESYGALHGVKSNVLRYANIYGPRQNPHGEAGVVAIFTTRGLQGESIFVNALEREGDDGCIRDYVFVGDVVRANVAAIDGKLEAPILDIGSGVGTNTRQLANAILDAIASEAVGSDAPTRSPVHDRPPRKGDVARSVIDGTMFEQTIGAMSPLSEGIAATVAAFRKARVESNA